jgi:signal transduction histidine kinase
MILPQSFASHLVPLDTLPLSPLDILKLVGFATGAALHLYLCWMLHRRYGIRRAERSLLGLGLSIALWHLGNFAAAIHDMLGIGDDALWWKKASNVVAYAALGFLPPLLAHAHFRVWGWFEKSAPRRYFKPLIIAGYLPLAILPWVVARLWSDPYEEPIKKLSVLLLPFICWFVFIFIECALIDWRLASKSEGVRERRFFEVFGASLAAIGALFLLTYVFGARNWPGIGSYLDLIARLSSIAPTTIVAYYIYRYRYLELVIRQSFVYAILAAVVMMVYIYGIRRLSLALEARYEVRAEVIEALLILVVMLLAGPLRRVTERYLQRLFAREVGLYRDLVAQVGAASASYGELRHFIAFAEKRLREALELEGLGIVVSSAARSEMAEACRTAEERQLTEIEDQLLLESLSALACYALWREGRVVGLLVVRGGPQSLTAEKREVLTVLAGHIAVAIENCQLLEEKVKLERELAERERLASLGQMAATVAHEVKNPLSSIKSIAQVMREDERVGSEYARDLDLITGEVDRLSRTVSQLLSFSRPGVGAASPASLQEIVESVLALTSAEAERGEVKVSTDLQANPQLDSEGAVALKEILLNLTLNAIQSIKQSGEVKIETASSGSDHLRISVSDEGIGIPAAMQEKVFEPFFTTKQRGTGLGLAIVARRVREMGGTISLVSPVVDGRGAMFVITLPTPLVYGKVTANLRTT